MVYRPGGFPEYTPQEQMIFDHVVGLIQSHYASFGYSHIHTPAVEANAVLLAKSGNETSKQIFGLYGLAQGAQDTKEYSLHFDLTIPFARYILDHEGELTFPFKRYQIQPVRRGERAQRGRFREFHQCDIDTVWRSDTKDSMVMYDAETLIVIADTLDAIRTIYFPEKSIAVHYNNVKLIKGLLSGYTHKDELFLLFDKYYKIGPEAFEKEVLALTAGEDAQRLLNFVKDSRTYLQNTGTPEGIQELQTLEKYLTDMNVQNYTLVFDPFITRGLDYYTGMVYETFFEDDMALGSISSGGRYDGLTQYIDPKRKFSGVGGSIGISRIMALIFERGTPLALANTSYLCVNFPETFADIALLAHVLRQDGNQVEIYPVADKLGKQFAYADKKGIPYVVILGSGEKSAGIYKIKTLLTGEETEHPL